MPGAGDQLSFYNSDHHDLVDAHPLKQIGHASFPGSDLKRIEMVLYPCILRRTALDSLQHRIDQSRATGTVASLVTSTAAICRRHLTSQVQNPDSAVSCFPRTRDPSIICGAGADWTFEIAGLKTWLSWSD